MQRVPAMIFGLLLASLLGGCGIDVTGDCAPHSQETLSTPDGRHVAARWVSICGAPGATVTDLVSVADGPVAQPPWDGVFAFNEDGVYPNPVSAAWIDDRRLLITIDALGDVRESPRHIDGVDISYALGHNADLSVVESKRDAKIEERHQWERLKTSASWHYVEDQYNFDAYLIEHYQKFIDWAKANATVQR